MDGERGSRIGSGQILSFKSHGCDPAVLEAVRTDRYNVRWELQAPAVIPQRDIPKGIWCNLRHNSAAKRLWKDDLPPRIKIFLIVLAKSCDHCVSAAVRACSYFIGIYFFIA